MEPIDILAIDDDKLVQKVIRRALEPHGFKVRSAFDGEAGLEEALAHPPQVVLLDVEMPKMNGYQVCERLVEEPAFEHVPIVFLSSHSSLQERMLGYEMGADDYVVKPFEAEYLLARISVLLRFAEQQQELSSKVQAAQQTALEALNSTSELGLAVSYMERSINFNTVPEAAQGLLQITEDMALACRMRITVDQHVWWFPSEEEVSPLEKELIEMSDHNQRFLDFGINTLINYPAVSLLITNMPLDDPSRYGRIKDLMPVLLSGLTSKIYALATQDALREHSDQLTHTIARIRSSLYQLGTVVLDSRKQSRWTLETMIQALQDDLLRMGLAEDEEQYLIDRIDASAEEAMDKMDTGHQVGQSFTFVHNYLKQVGAQQRALAEAFEQVMEEQKQISHATSGDIELF